ncbi:uroporphyrinogen decarboxylase [Enemella dayhoffiae]|uniref:Uroporphyrinogen decarboxylase n=1 Tax=Enemella dayhoffiae TaxID=2016507 RepID=A0A255H5Y6_9ACTN|nr:uroporphyrinogen decarboxylase [Enemella dayhoffiae]
MAAGAGAGSCWLAPLEPRQWVSRDGFDAPWQDGAVTETPAEPTGSDLVNAARGVQGERVPVWFMRQAGRSLPEYRQVREGTTMLEACFTPDLVREITMQPVRRHGVDAAIFYSDIMVPLKAAGVDLDIVPGRGPQIAHPISSRADVEALRPLEVGQLDAISEAVRLVVEELGGPDSSTALIGFAGAPFTLASYLVEGGPSKDYAATKALMVGDPELWHELCSRLAQLSAVFLQAQVAAGARVVQLFDSWAGALSARDYREYVMPHSAMVLAALKEHGVPRIHFGVGTGELLPLIGQAGAEVVGVDWRIPLDEASRRLGRAYAVQGNLDPALLGAPWSVLAERVRRVVREGAAAKGHIFNLGHGVPPTADPTVLTRIVELVHTEGPDLRAQGRAVAEQHHQEEQQ